MGFDFASLIGGSIGDAFQKIVGAFKVPPAQQLEAQTEITKIQLELQGKILDQIGQQLDVNRIEAASTSTFVAGWRPFIGWICGLGLASQFIIGPLVTWVATLAKHPVVYPTLDLGTLMTLLFGMLGLGGMRSWEKVQGVPGSEKVH